MIPIIFLLFTLTGSPQSDVIVAYARTYVGTSYTWGGTTLDFEGESYYLDFDCSSFVRAIYSDVFGVSLPRTALNQWQSKLGKKLKYPADLKTVSPGCLIFFNLNPKRARVSHVGIISEVEGSRIKMIHATLNRGEIVEEFLPDRYYKKIVGIKSFN